MAAYSNAIIHTGVDECKALLFDNTWSYKRLDVIKDCRVFYQWGTDKINISILVQIFINAKIQ